MSKKKKTSEPFTIEKLYQIAKARGYEDKPLEIEYICDDDWYDYENPLRQTDIVFADDKAKISINTMPF